MPSFAALFEPFAPSTGATTLLNGERHASASIAAVRFCAFRRCVGANAGTGMLRRMSFLYGMSGCGAGLNSPSSTSDAEWLVRVVRRNMTGTLNCSDNSNAFSVKS